MEKTINIQTTTYLREKEAGEEEQTENFLALHWNDLYVDNLVIY